MTLRSHMTAEQVIRKLEHALNSHDVEQVVACFAPDYASDFPAHPGRAFGGHDQTRRNWTRMFADVPDLHAALLSVACEQQVVMAEWAWDGHHPDGTVVALRGVTVQQVHDDRIVWVRLYMEPVSSGPVSSGPVFSGPVS